MAAWLDTLKQWLGGARHAPSPATEDSEPEPPLPPDIGEHHAAHGSEEDPEQLHRGRRRLKETYTSHWDLDYLSREEVERIAEANEKKN